MKTAILVMFSNKAKKIDQISNRYHKLIHIFKMLINHPTIHGMILCFAL